MWKFIVYGVLLVLYVVSFALEAKFDNSKHRQVFLWVWIIFMLAAFTYPLIVLSGWFKFLFLLSFAVIFASISIEGNKRSGDEGNKNSSPI